MLTIQNLTKKYGTNYGVKDLSLTVQDGEIMGFIGHNGAGKTTTLRCVAGILSYDAGEILMDGHSVERDPVKAKQLMAFLPDNPDIYEYMTGIGYLNFIADIYGIPKAEREQRIKTYSDAYQITEVLGNKVGAYSHGMRQKLALISAFIRQPKLLILDEPFVGLDPSASHMTKNFLRQLCMNGGSVFFSTHVLEVAEKLCHRVAIIRGGELVEVGRMEDVVGNSDLESVFLELQGEEEEG